MLWLGFISFTGLLILVEKAKNDRKAFLYGFMFGFGHHVTGLYWISNSLLVEPEKFAWLIPFAVSLIPAYLSLYIGLLCWLTKKLKYKGIAKIMFFSGAWVMAEIIRGHVLTGFPWNLAGYVFLKNLDIAQFGSIIGFYGMSLLAVFLFSCPYAIISAFDNAYRKGFSQYKIGYSLMLLLPVSIIFISISYWGYQRIKDNKNREEDVNIRVVQPNIPQREKFDRLRIGEHLYNYYSLSLTQSEMENFVPDIIVWPEAATPYNLKESNTMLEELRDIIPFSSYLILGSVRVDGIGIDSSSTKVFNSIEIVNSEGQLQQTHYDKHHLVPFGEYVPFRRFLPFLNKITHGNGDFSEGKGLKTIKLDNSPPFSPLICYEIIFPGKVVRRTPDTKAKWIVNVTNDGWFGLSKGPYQHLDTARARAIEEGVPIVRAANTGISAVIDSLGRVLKEVGLNEKGVIDAKLPSALHFDTFFSRFGLIIPILLAGFVISSAGCLKFFYRSS